MALQKQDLCKITYIYNNPEKLFFFEKVFGKWVNALCLWSKRMGETVAFDMVGVDEKNNNRHV